LQNYALTAPCTPIRPGFYFFHFYSEAKCSDFHKLLHPPPSVAAAESYNEGENCCGLATTCHN